MTRLSIVGVSSFLVLSTTLLVATCTLASWQDNGNLIDDSAGLPYDVSIIEAVGVPEDLAIPWLLLPDEPFLPGILVADLSLVRKLEAAGAKIDVLGKYVEWGSYYLVQSSPFVNGETLSRTSEVIWSKGDAYLVHSEEGLRDELKILGFQVRLLRPFEKTLASLARVQPVSQRDYSSIEKFWINRMVNEVSESDLLDYLNSLTGEKAVNLAGGLDTILTRYSYTPGCEKAAEYIYEQLDSMGLSVAYDCYVGVELRTLAFMGLKGYVAGSFGTIYHTDDGGASWAKQSSGTTAMLWKSSFIAPDTGWISGARGLVLRTYDGGSTWDSLSTGTRRFLSGVEFVNAFTGWVCGDGGIILKTVDGGLTWFSQQGGTQPSLYGDVEFVDTRNGWAVGENGEIIHTADGGEHWSSQTSGVGSRLYDVFFGDSLRGWAVGGGGTIVRTVDGGSSWKTVESSVTSFLFGLCFADSLHGWIVGSDGVVLSTRDGGVRWTVQQRGANPPLYGVSFVDSLHGWAVGICSVIHTDNGGTTWLSATKNIPDKWRNVIGTKNGTSNPSRSYIVCGHFDSFSQDPMNRAPGADDDASGTSVVLEAARILKDFPFLASIKFVCFSGEEQWLLGSEHYVRGAFYAGEDIGGVLNLDMVGYGGPPILLHAIGASDWLEDYCLAVRDSFVDWLDLRESLTPTGAGDHASFTDAGYIALDVTETAMRLNPNYHTIGDTVGTLTISMIADVARVAVASLASLAGLDTSRVPGPPGVPEVLLARNYPNPFGPSTHIPFELPAMRTRTRYVVAVLDPAGRTVKILEEGRTGEEPLRREVVWDGTNEMGKRAACGVYLCSLRCGRESRVRKIVLIR